ncbi:twin-arginine translocase TatA/TatE family subunit [Nocardioides zeicaulis]|uniref:Sec-independent protein translocase protein TatA n=1 Tax=Nocardioides zeicaulis TaxID=1776857 RepID=A0ABV6E6J0_9ACTN
MIDPMIGMPQGAEWLVILAIVVLVFGAAKLPELARSSGQALKIFKDETKNLKDDDAKRTSAAPDALETRPEVTPTETHETSGEVLHERRDDTTT